VAARAKVNDSSRDDCQQAAEHEQKMYAAVLATSKTMRRVKVVHLYLPAGSHLFLQEVATFWSHKLVWKLFDYSLAQAIRHIQDLLMHGVVSRNVTRFIAAINKAGSLSALPMIQPCRGLVKGGFSVSGNKIRVSPNNENVKGKLPGKY